MPLPRTPRAEIIKVPILHDRIKYRDSADVVAAANAAAIRYRDATPEERAGRRNPLREEIRVHQDAYVALRMEKRALEVVQGKRHPGGGVDIVSHISGDGVPDTSSDDGAVYWDEVTRAVEMGVPNVLGTQR